MSIKVTRDDIMGMPISVEVVADDPTIVQKVFEHFIEVDNRFSTYKQESEIMQLNNKKIAAEDCSTQMQEVFAIAKTVEEHTNGYFSITQPNGLIDPSGVVKGWSILKAGQLIESLGCTRYFIDAGGDIQSRGLSTEGIPWTVGIRNPFDEHTVVKVIQPDGLGVATSGTSVRGNHIYNPHTGTAVDSDVVSITVVGPNICEADCFATGAFAMGEQGVYFIEQHDGFEAYQIDTQGIATMTTGFNQYII